MADDLRKKIVSGALAAGARLPSERALADDYSVARNTAREAIRLLSDQGLVSVEHGRGAFVRVKPRLMRFGNERYSRTLREQTGLSPYRAEVVKQGRQPRVECTSITTVKPPEDVAERLGIDPKETSAVRRENWYYADDEPVQLGVTYIPSGIVEGSALSHSADMGKGSMYARFEDLGYSIASIREEITSRMPTPDEVAGLAIPDGVPVLDVLHTGLDDKSRPFEVTRFIMRADLNGLDYSMPVEGI